MNRNPWNMNKNINANINSLIKNMEECKIDVEEDEVEVIIEKPEKEEKKNIPFVYQSFQSSFQPQPLKTFTQSQNRQSNLYSRFCNNIIQEGICKHPTCTFAHTIEQYSPMKCKFNCQNRRCQYYHAWENIQEYIERNNIFVHENIKMNCIVEDAKNSITRDIQKIKDNPHTSLLKLTCDIYQVAIEISKLNKLGYNNINVLIKENVKTKIVVENLDNYVSFLNRNIHNFTFDKLDVFLTKEKYRLSFVLNTNSFFYIRNLIVNGEEIFLNKAIQGELDGLQFINKIHECVSSKIPKAYNLRKIEIVEESKDIVIDVIIDQF